MSYHLPVFSFLQEVKEAGLEELTGLLDYWVEEGYNEDLEATTLRPLDDHSGPPVHVISLAVLFALLGAMLLGIGVFFLLRRWRLFLGSMQ